MVCIQIPRAVMPSKLFAPKRSQVARSFPQKLIDEILSYLPLDDEHGKRPPAATSLPQELIDEILSYLPLDDEHGKQSLRNCSLVSSRWINPCRRHLFKTIEIQDTNLQSLLDSVPPANDGLFQHVHSLTYIVRVGNISPPLEYPIDTLRDYLPFLHRLQHLSLSSLLLSPRVSQQVDLFSAFRHTLSWLSLSHCRVTISAFVALINYFPNLDRLDITHIVRWVDAKPVPPLSRQIIGQLHIFELYRTGFGLFDQLSAAGLAFDEIVFGEHPQVPLLSFERTVGAVGANVKHLRLLKPLQRVDWPRESVAISRCQELREFEISVAHPGSEEVALVSSISPTSIQKVIFVCQPFVRDPSRSDTGWEILDIPLYQLADQLRRKRVLEVEFRLMGTGVTGENGRTGGLEIANSLKRFKEIGQITVVWVGSGGSETVYSSDRVG